MRVLGVDGTKRRWIAVVLDDGRFAGAHVHERFDALMSAHEDAVVIAVDMPIGLVESGLREPDAAARKAVGSRRSSVFMTPPRVVVEQPEWGAALEMARVHMGMGISKQAFALFKSIQQVDAYVADARLFEVHPEVSFACLAGGPLDFSKKSWNGAARRRALLAAAGIELPSDLGPAGTAPVDDVLDAAVAAWSASRIATGKAVSLPAVPGRRDRSGRAIAIWS